MRNRLLSAMLAAVLVLLALPVIGFSAVAEESGYQNTSELFNADLGTVYATKGTPTLGSGNTDDWANAYSFTVRTLYAKGSTDGNGQQVTIDGVAYELFYTYVVYSVMWDENNLYILESRPYDTIQYFESPASNYNWANWSGGGIDMTCLRLVLPTDIDAENGKYGADNLVYIGTGVRETDAAGTVADSVRQARVAVFDGSGKNSKENYADYLGKFSAVTSKTTRTTYGFYMETAIPWSVLDDYDKTDFVAEAGKTMGLGLDINANNHNCATWADADESRNFRPLTLVEENPTASYVEPDFSWYTDSADKTEFLISDEADLMGLNLLMSYGMEDKHYKNTAGNNHLKDLCSELKLGHWRYAQHTDAMLLKGKTVRLAKDMDLNAGWLADGSGKALANEWVPVALYGTTFDGDGHSISGISTVTNLCQTMYNGFFSYVATGSTVKNLTLKNGVVGTAIDDVTATGGVAGRLLGESKTDGITLLNVTCALNVTGRNAKESVGGMVAIAGGGASGMTITMKNCEYAGTVGNPANDWVAAIAVTADDAKTALKATNCIYTGSAAAPALYKWAIKNGETTISGNFYQTKTAEDGTISLRLVGVLNNKNLTYRAETLTAVGYDVMLERNGQTSETRSMCTETVYESVKAAGETVKASELGGDLLYALVINGIPATGTVTFRVTPVYQDAAGNEVQPLSETITVTIAGGVVR